MNLLFVHQNFPGQYRHLAAALVARGDRVVAIGGPTAQPLKGVSLHRYNPMPAGGVPPCHSWLGDMQSKVLRAEAVAARIEALRRARLGVYLVIGHPGWGTAGHQGCVAGGAGAAPAGILQSTGGCRFRL